MEGSVTALFQLFNTPAQQGVAIAPLKGVAASVLHSGGRRGASCQAALQETGS
jgi:hypothetical protein